MTAKRISQLILVVAVLAASFASTGAAMAGSACGSNYTVQSGDTLDSIAAACGTTVADLQAANPGLGSTFYAGQVLSVPVGTTSSPSYAPEQMTGGTYVVQVGDTLGSIAARFGVPMNAMMAVNPQVWNPSLIYPGQVLNLPGLVNSAPSTYYQPTYTQPTYNQPTYYSPSYYQAAPYLPTTNYPPPTNLSPFSVLKVTYGHGLMVRTGPGVYFPIIHSVLINAVRNSYWRYRRGSVTMDPFGMLWVEVLFDQVSSGYSSGWMMVKDSLGNYFTLPNIDH